MEEEEAGESKEEKEKTARTARNERFTMLNADGLGLAGLLLWEFLSPHSTFGNGVLKLNSLFLCLNYKLEVISSFRFFFLSPCLSPSIGPP